MSLVAWGIVGGAVALVALTWLIPWHLRRVDADWEAHEAIQRAKRKAMARA